MGYSGKGGGGLIVHIWKKINLHDIVQLKCNIKWNLISSIGKTVHAKNGTFKFNSTSEELVRLIY